MDKHHSIRPFQIYNKNKFFAHFIAFLIFIVTLSSCSVLREDLRSTYDYKVLAPGSTREAIENEIGSPDKNMQTKLGEKAYIYSTDKVDWHTKDNLIGSHVGLDMFLLGTPELLDPMAIRDDESKIFVVFYNPDNIATRVLVTCENGRIRGLIDILPNPKSGIMCGESLKG